MKEFNVEGVCIPEIHYMVKVDEKLSQINKLIERNKYFTINRARQYGKTTTLSSVLREFDGKYLVLKISFEGLGDFSFSSDKAFNETFISLVAKRLKQNKVDSSIVDNWVENKDNLDKLEDLSDKITNLAEESDKEILLLIDEVDKSSNNQLFLHFLGMLRNKYLDRADGLDSTFKSVILAGVYDVKNLKLKLRDDEEKKFNSPWNIAAEFDVDMSFNPREISTMLEEYEKDYKMGMDIEVLSKEIYNFTSGYPFLVSSLCKTIDEKLDKNWSLQGLQDAVKILLDESNTLFDDLIKNIENYKDIYNVAYSLLIDNENISYNRDVYSLGIMLGILKNEEGKLAIHNKIFEIRLYNYMIGKKHSEEIGRRLSNYTTIGMYENEDGTLDIHTALLKYQEYMKSVYGKFDKEFIERQGRLLLLAFFKPIINGKGFYFVESQTGFEQRQDVVITFGKKKYIIELKIWRGEKYHQQGIQQLNEYLELENADEGYLVIYDKTDKKEYKTDNIKLNEKDVFAIWV